VQISRRILIVLALVAGLVGFGTVGFHLIEHWAWFDCFYATLMTVSTIGAEPENQLSLAGRYFNAVLIFLSLGVIGYTIGMLTHGLIQSELGRFFGRRRMEKEIANVRDHFVICGLGRVGRRIAADVRAQGFPVVVVEKEAARAGWAEDRGLPLILGDAASEAVLAQAHVERARGLASAVTTDAQNVYIVLTARSMAPKLFIVGRASEEDAESKLLKAGADAVVSPYTYAGVRMARLMTRPHVQRFLDLALSSLGGAPDLQMDEIEVADRCSLAGLTLREADLRKRLGLLVLAIRRKDGKLQFNPDFEEKILSGDFLIALGESENLKKLEDLAGVA
jgi:voltage-gated potassium channel